MRVIDFGKRGFVKLDLLWVEVSGRWIGGFD